MPNSIAKMTLNEMKINKYLTFLEVYTDGSKLYDPEISAAAADIVRTHTSDMFNWKLSPETTILGCELFALERALNHIESNFS